MRILFIITDKTTENSLLPVLDLFIRNGYESKLLVNNYCINSLKCYSQQLVKEDDAMKVSWEFVISANPISKDKFKGRVVGVHHGSMFGNSAWTLFTALNSDIYFGLSPHELPFLKHHLKDKFNEENFIPSGNPANDYLIDILNSTSDMRTTQRNLFGLEEKKTILLSSHWTSIGNLRKFGIGLLDALIWNFPNYQIICTCHPKLLTNPKREFLVNQPSETPHFDARWLINSLKAKQSEQVRVFLDGPKAAELAFVSDIFIGDNSSLLAEASLFNIPLIRSSGGFYFDKTISKIVSSASYEFENVEGLLGEVRYVDDTKQKNMKSSKKIQELFMYNLGLSAKTIFDTLISMR